MSMAKTPSETPGGALTALLAQLLEANTALHTNVVAQREAIRAAEPQRSQRLTEEHARLMGVLASLDQRRREVVVELSRALGLPKGGRTPTLSELAKHLAEPERTRVLTLAGQVRERMERVQRESASLRSAARTLAAHMEGLMRHVGRQLTSAGVYSARGQLTAGGSMAVALDLKS